MLRSCWLAGWLAMGFGNWDVGKWLGVVGWMGWMGMVGVLRYQVLVEAS